MPQAIKASEFIRNLKQDPAWAGQCAAFDALGRAAAQLIKDGGGGEPARIAPGDKRRPAA